MRILKRDPQGEWMPFGDMGFEVYVQSLSAIDYAMVGTYLPGGYSERIAEILICSITAVRGAEDEQGKPIETGAALWSLIRDGGPEWTKAIMLITAAIMQKTKLDATAKKKSENPSAAAIG